MQRDTPQCNATRRDGSCCKSPVVLPSGYCPMHDPERRREVAGMRADGGKAKSRARRLDRLVPATLRPVLATLLDALDGVHAPEGDDSAPRITPAQAHAMASLAGAILKVYGVATFEERLAALEEELQQDAGTARA